VTIALIFLILLISCWFLFAGITLGVINLTDRETVCVAEVNTFIEALLFSIETGTTIGYGSRSINGQCFSFVFSWIVFIVLCKVLECIFCSLLFLKFSEWIKITHRDDNCSPLTMAETDC